MTRRVLVVDDEAPLLRLIEDFLSRNGYETEAYADPLRALAQFGVDPGRFQLVVADVTMPALSGVDLIYRLSELSSDILMLLLSGLPFSTNHLPAAIRHRVGFLQKPFVPRMLLEAVRELEGRSPRPGHCASESAC